MNYQEAVQYLNSLSRFGWRLGLERMEALCERLDHPESAFDTIHVAGTNGKGSTSTLLAAVLQSAGYRTGLYTSPHLYDGRERIRIDGSLIDPEAVSSILEELIPHIQAVSQEQGAVTEFEAWTCVMFRHFQRSGVQTAVIEAGLGGRWDSTNVIQPVLAILTNVSLDHTDRLGNTVAEIAHDKAGIIKTGGVLLTGALPPDARAEVELEARQQGAMVFSVLSERDLPGPGDPQSQFFWEDLDRTTIALTAPGGQRTVLPFSGAHYQGRNAATVAAAVHLLREQSAYRISEEALHAGLQTTVPGRFQIVRREPEVILDAAHNVAAAAVLAAELAQGRVTAAPAGASHPQLRLVFGSSSGHDGEGCLKILAPQASEVILTRARNPRSQNPQELAATVESAGVPVEIIPDVATAVNTAIRRSAPSDRVCVTGSFFVLGEVPGME